MTQETQTSADMLDAAPPRDEAAGALIDDRGDIPPPAIRIVEALLFVGGAPLTAQRVSEIIRGFSSEQLAEAVGTLNRAYRLQNRPYTVQIHMEGFSLVLRPKYRGVTQKLYGAQREAR